MTRDFVVANGHEPRQAVVSTNAVSEELAGGRQFDKMATIRSGKRLTGPNHCPCLLAARKPGVQ
jgi:hypothetical protein